MRVNNEKDLGNAIKNKVDEIIIEGDLKNKVIRIKATKKMAWAIAIAAIGTSVAALLATPTTGGLSNVANLFTVPTAIGILGASTSTAAVKIAVSAGSVKALDQLRNYKIVKKDDENITLKK